MSKLLMGTEAVKNAPVTITLPGLLHHTLIVGQSGSGKSFFVARLVEEILLRTSARVVALDPNGDLRTLEDVDMSAMTEQREGVDRAAQVAGLSQLDNDADFTDLWTRQRIVFLNSAERHPDVQPVQRVERRRLVLDWATMDDEQDALLELDSHQRPAQLLGVKACREFVAYSQTGKSARLPDSLRGLADAASKFLEQNINMYRYEYAKHLQPSDWSNVRARFLDLIARHQIWAREEPRAEDGASLVSMTDLIDAAFDQASGIPEWNALVIGLDAARQPDALLSASVALGRIWKDAKDLARRASPDEVRYPTFIVIDEAHNFAPAHTDDPLRRRVSDRILQIASEGRKYGLYLILATQRPTKLNPELVPECENSCVLRVQSERELRFAAETLGIPSNRVEGAARFTQGQGLMTGRWVGGNVVDVIAAPARTKVGGGGLGAGWMAGPREISLPERPIDLDSSTLFPATSWTNVATRVEASLRASERPVVLVELANTIKNDPELGCGPQNLWFGTGSLKSMLALLPIENLEVLSKAPGYAWLSGVHEAPEPPDPRTPTSLPTALSRIRQLVDVPPLSPTKYQAVFEALADELAVNPFRLADTSKAVRDALHEAGHDIGRSAINFILKGIHLAGHDFSADRPQDPMTLGRAFVDSLVGTTAQELDLTPDQIREVSDWIVRPVNDEIDEI